MSPARLPLTGILALLALLTLVGCETVSDRPKLTEPFAVSRGMAAEEIVAHLGEPDLKHPLHEYSVHAEVWVYNRTLKSDSRMVITGTQAQRLWDPVNQVTITVDMPVYQPETSAVVEVSEILMVADRVYSWKRKTINNRDVEGLSR